MRLAKKLINGISYGQRRNQFSGRTVREISITADDLVEMYAEQQGLCHWSGLSLDSKFNNIKHHPFAISPERLDNSKSYTRDNVVLCRRIFNLGRMDFPEADFRDIMKSLKDELNTHSTSGSSRL